MNEEENNSPKWLYCWQKATNFYCGYGTHPASNYLPKGTAAGAWNLSLTSNKFVEQHLSSSTYLQGVVPLQNGTLYLGQFYTLYFHVVIKNNWRLSRQVKVRRVFNVEEMQEETPNVTGKWSAQLARIVYSGYKKRSIHGHKGCRFMSINQLYIRKLLKHTKRRKEERNWK
jgi:hypothetical protein